MTSSPFSSMRSTNPDDHLAALLAAPSLTSLAKAIGIRPRKGGFIVTACDGKYSIPYNTDRPVVWPTLEDACQVAFGAFISQPPNPFQLGGRIILADDRETLYGNIEFFCPRNHLDIGLDPRGWGRHGDCDCTFQLPQGGFMGGWFLYSQLQPDPANTPFTNPRGEEHATRLEAWAQRMRPHFEDLKIAAALSGWVTV